MRVDRYPPPIVAHCQSAIGVQLHLNPRGMACHSLIHRVVDDFGRQMVISALVNPADIHPRPQAHGL